MEKNTRQPDYRKLADKEFRNKIAWWMKSETRQPLSDEWKQLMQENEEEFIQKVKAHAFWELVVSYYDYGQYRWVQHQTREEVEKKDGSWLWTLYLTSHPVARKALFDLLSYHPKNDISKVSGVNGYFYDNYTNHNQKTYIPLHPIYYRYLKGMYKHAEIRRDAEIWGKLACRFDSERCYYYRSQQSLHSRETRLYLVRRSWRTLRNLGKNGSPDYVNMATELLLNYTDSPRYLHARSIVNNKGYFYSRTYLYYSLMNYVIYKNSKRFILTKHDPIWKVVSSEDCNKLLPFEREEAFPGLWDQAPEQLYRLFKQAKCTPIIEFAGRALFLSHPEFVSEIDHKTLKQMTQSSNYTRRTYSALLLLAQSEQKGSWMDTWFSYFEQGGQISGVFREFLVRKLDTFTIQQKEDLVRSILSRLQSGSLKREAMNQYSQLLQNELKPLLAHFSTWELILSFAQSGTPDLTELACQMLQEIPESKINFTGRDLLPLLHTNSPRVNEMVRTFINRHWLMLQLDVSFMVDLAMIPGEEQRVFVTQFISDRLHLMIPSMKQELVSELWKRMLDEAYPEDVREYLRDHLIGSVFFSELLDTPFDQVMQLINHTETPMQQLGSRILQMNKPNPVDLSFQELKSLAHCRIASTRTEALTMILSVKERVTSDWMVNLVETHWDDVRNWMFGYIGSLTSNEITPDLIYGLLDTARRDIQEFAMNLVEIHKKHLDTRELLLRASESTDLVVQEFALSLADQVIWDETMIEKLDLFFRTVLFRVNQGRKAKKVALEILLNLGMEKKEFAMRIIPILSDVAHNGTKKDFEKILLTLTQIKSTYPELASPITIH